MKNLKNYLQFNEDSDNYFEHNSMIDYTLLETTSTREDIIELCKKANILGVKSVCVLPKDVKLASEQLEGSNVLVCTVISFPHGTDTPEQKLEETKKVIADGADEVDMVISHHILTDNNNYDDKNHFLKFDDMVEEVFDLSKICHSKRNKDGEEIILKVIVESGLLNKNQVYEATNICCESDADFIKTSTGKISGPGAEIDKVKIMKEAIDDWGHRNRGVLKIKASGGIRTEQDIEKFLPYVDRFGIGCASVDKINGIGSSKNINY